MSIGLYPFTLISLLCLLAGSGDLALPGSPRISPVMGFTKNEIALDRK